MTNIRVFYLKIFSFCSKIFYIFEEACFCNGQMCIQLVIRKLQVRSPLGPATFSFMESDHEIFSTVSAVVSFWQKNVHYLS